MSQPVTDTVQPRLIRHALERYGALIVACMIGLASAAWIAMQLRTDYYAASAKILLLPTLGNPLGPNAGSSGPQVTIAMETEATLVDSEAVAKISNASLDLGWEAGGGAVKANVPPSTQILKVTFTAPTPEQAQKGAQSVAESYLTYRKQRSDTTEKAREAKLKSQFDDVSKRLDAVTKQLSDNQPGSAAASRQQQLLTDQYASLSDQLSQLSAGDNNPGLVLSPPQRPVKTQGISTRLVVLSGAFLGIAVGLVLAIGLMRTDTRLRHSTATVGDVRVLATFGADRRWWRSTSEQPGHALRAAHQQLCTGIMAAVPSASTIAVTDVGAEPERVGDVVRELAESFHRSGYRVIVVIAEMDRYTAGLFGVSEEPGLSEVLISSRRAIPLLVERDGMSMLPPGENLLDHQELLSGDRFAAILNELSTKADYVLVAAPPATSPVGVAIARLTTATLFVGRELRTTTTDVNEALTRARSVGAKIIGIALRGRDQTR
ncbi:MAG: hypothetical protein ACRCTR_07585 [Actinomycetota bacterium]